MHYRPRCRRFQDPRLGFVRRYRVVVPGHIIWSSGCSTISALVMGVLVGRFAELLGIYFYTYFLKFSFKFG